MVKPLLTVPVPGAHLAERFAAIRNELEVPDAFPPAALDEASAAAAGTADRSELPDWTDIPFVTLDPVGSMDLDQAMHLSRDGQGWRVRYAIADVPSVVIPGGALDAETHRRGVTVYCPDTRVPLHPPILSEHAASLLPGQVRRAYVWDLLLDDRGEVRDRALTRALVRSAERLDYAGAQADLDAGSPHEQIAALRAVGTARMALEAARGGASLPMPEQEVHQASDGGYTVAFRPPLATEEWNAQISLMTGMTAAAIMLDGTVGILRTMPEPGHDVLERFRRQTRSLGAPWEPDRSYGAYLRGLDRSNPRHLAVIHQAARLFRGAGYAEFDGHVPAERVHAAVAAPYAHVTAPLRRLVDRYGLVICHALANDLPVPQWARAALADLPFTMAKTDRVAGSVDRLCIDAVEAAVLAARVGSTLPATALDQVRAGLLVHIEDPAIVTVAEGSARPGDRVEVEVVSVSVESSSERLRVKAARPGPTPSQV
jgi:exoribonuclease R